ncbi:SAM-dependent methyltransferase [Bdellovibrionota bacterium FG-1]
MNPRQLCIIAKDHKDELLQELAYLGVTRLYATDLTIGVQEDDVEPAWAQSVWRKVQSIKIESIGDAQRKLKEISKSWRYHGDLFNRRGALIADGLNLAKASRPFRFPSRGEKSPPPVFTLAEPDLILYSQEIRRPTYDGNVSFIENKGIPPSRAYLKLWEALTVLGDWPRANDTVVDLGSSPGSWSWALAELGANVLSIDRSELSDQLRKYKNIEFTAGDAFSFVPRKMDWVFSDVICYPEKLYEYMRTWTESGYCQKFVCSVKFAGNPDYRMIDQFRKLPHSRVLHLCHNKNEVTWICHPKIGGTSD